MSYKDRIFQIKIEMEILQKERMEIQSKCPHDNTEEVDYSYRVGNTYRAEICSDCEKFMR